MLPENRSALKEWAVVARALGSGRQTLLLRKGGIHERRGEFEVELDQPLPTAGSSPVLPEIEFRHRLEAIRRILASAAA